MLSLARALIQAASFSHLQNVLRSSVLPSPPSTTPAPPPPSHADLVERYGPLFADAISKEWQNGGRDVHEAISGGRHNVGGGGGGAAATATAAGDADEDEQEQEQEQEQEHDDADADEDDEDEMDDAM